MRLVPFNDVIPVWNGLESKVRLPFATVTLCGNRVLLLVIYRRDPSRNLRTPAVNLIASLACSDFITGCFVGYGRAIIEFSAYFETSVPKALHAILDLGGAESLAITTRHTSNSCQDNRHLPAVLDGLRAAPPVLLRTKSDGNSEQGDLVYRSPTHHVTLLTTHRPPLPTTYRPRIDYLPNANALVRNRLPHLSLLMMVPIVPTLPSPGAPVVCSLPVLLTERKGLEPYVLAPSSKPNGQYGGRRGSLTCLLKLTIWSIA